MDIALEVPTAQALVSITMGVVLWALQEAATPPIQRWLDAYTSAHPVSKPKDLHKFPGVVCNWCMHVVPAVAASLIVWRERWLSEPEGVWAGFPQQTQKPEYVLLYLYCNGYHLQRLWRLVRKPGSDWIEMGLHHVITVFLLVESMCLGVGAMRVGIIVLMLNDIADLFVYAGKISSLLDWKRVTGYVTFPLLSINWFYWRIWFFARTVIPIANMGPNDQLYHRAAVNGRCQRPVGTRCVECLLVLADD
eukprot:PhM_4_TR5202/c4_g1_i4/m.50868/K04710/CERS; ceramide synthetase